MAIDINSSNVDLIMEIHGTNSSSVIIAAINHTNANESVLKQALDKAMYTDSENSIYKEIIKSNVVTSKILVAVIRKNFNGEVIIEALKSPRVDESVLEAASANAKYTDAEKSINNVIDAVRSTLKKKVNVPIINMQQTQVRKQGNDMIKEDEIMVEKEDNVTERIRRNVEDGMSSMLWGLSGIGKTARVKEVDPTYTMIKLKNGMLPEEVTGGKEPNGEPGQMYPPKWYVKLCEKCEKEPDRMHILFIDELTNVKDNVKTLVWDIIEDRRVNGDEDWTLPENCAIVAAGNRPEESTAVQTDYNGGVLPEPLHDRFDFHIEIPLDMQEWQLWALETNPKTGNLNIHPTVLSFCVSHADTVMFTSLDITKITQPRLSPRRWEKLSRAIYMAEKRGGKNCHVSDLRIEECIGSNLAPAFIAHYKKTPINMNWVEEGKYSANDFTNIEDKLFALGSLIAEYKGDPMCVEDFIATCLGEDYVVLYNVMKKRREETLLNSTKINESEKIEKVNFAKQSA